MPTYYIIDQESVRFDGQQTSSHKVEVKRGTTLFEAMYTFMDRTEDSESTEEKEDDANRIKEQTEEFQLADNQLALAYSNEDQLTIIATSKENAAMIFLIITLRETNNPNNFFGDNEPASINLYTGE